MKKKKKKKAEKKEMAEFELKDYLNLFSVLLYGSLLLFSLFQFFRIFLNRHQLLSFHAVFLNLCALWMLLRLVLFSLLLAVEVEDTLFNPSSNFLLPWQKKVEGEEPDRSQPVIFAPEPKGSKVLPNFVFFPLAWLPVSIQFATFTLLVLFFARVAIKLNPATKTLWEEKYKVRYFAVWGVTNLLFFFAIIAAIVLICTETISSTSSVVMAARSLTAGFIYLVLVIFLTIYGLRLYCVLQAPLVRYIPLQSNGTSIPGITVLTGLLLAVFLCRTVYCIVFATEILKHETFLGEEPLFQFISLFVSEILPVFAILMFFRKIPTSRSRKRQLIPPVFYNSVINEDKGNDPPTTSFFDDPQRYDSDEEKTPSPSTTQGVVGPSYQEKKVMVSSANTSSYGSFA